MENFPFVEEMNYLIKEIDGFMFNYLPYMGLEIQKMLIIRDEMEKSYRVTEIIDYDFFKTKKKVDKTYMKTYLHDRLLDVTCNYFKKYENIIDVDKEKFIYKEYNGKKVLGHVDILINNDTIGEIKNYTGSKINKDIFLKFIHQIMIYSLFLGVNKAFLFINNPPRYKKRITVFEFFFNDKTIQYIKNFLNVTLSIPDIQKDFKYK